MHVKFDEKNVYKIKKMSKLVKDFADLEIIAHSTPFAFVPSRELKSTSNDHAASCSSDNTPSINP